jgi:hypothetical protein
MAEPKQITSEEYGKGFIDFYQPFEIVEPTTPISSEPLPDLGASTGIQTSVQKPDINVNIKKITDSNHNPTVMDADGKENPYFNVLTKSDFTGTAIKHVSYDAMTAGLDKVDKPNAKDYLSFPSAFGLVMGGDYGVGTVLEGPTGQGVFSLGIPSEMAISNHMTNFAASEYAYGDMNKQLAAGKFKSPMDYMKTNDTGFAAVIGGFHFSRNPKKGYYEGHLGHLHSDSHTAHMMLKSIEALSKGFDPRGGDPQRTVRLKGYEIGEGADNSENGGASPAVSSNGMAAITNDGYYTYVSGADLGHTKSILRGLGDETKHMLKVLQDKGYTNLTKDQMLAAMATARTGSMTFTQAINRYKVENMVASTKIEDILAGAGESFRKGFTSNITGVGDKVISGAVSDVKGEGIASPMPTKPASSALQTVSTLSGFTPTYASKPGGNLKSLVKPVGSRPTGPATDTVGGIDYSGSIKAQEDAANIARQRAMDDRQAEREANQAKAQKEEKAFKDLQDKYGGSFNTGGSVGNLASLLRASRLGYNQGGAVQSGYYGFQEGGQINMQEMGFVNGKTPDQVTEAQTVADTEPMTVEEGDFVINAAAVELVGVENLVGLVTDALNKASDEGVQIVDIPVDVEPQMMVDVLVSEGEFIVPRELIPYIEGGIETLERINNAGKPEVENRIEATEMMQQDMQQELPEEQIPTQPQPAMPALNTGGMVKLNFDRGFV